MLALVAPMSALGLTHYALGSLARHRSRAITLVLGLSLLAFAFASVFAVTDALRGVAMRAAKTLPDLTISRLHAGRPATMTTAQVSEIQAIAGVGGVRPRVWGYLEIDSIRATAVVVGATAPELARHAGPVLDGRLPTDPGARGWVVLGESVARTFGSRAGDELDLGGRTFRVAARCTPESSLLSADLLLMDPHDARALLHMAPDEVTDLAVHVPNEAERGTVAAHVQARWPTLRIAAREELARAYELTFSGRGGLVGLALVPALLALLLLAWDRLTSLGPDDRREVAVLKSLGWSTRALIYLRMIESALIAVAAMVLATLAAHGYVYVLGAPGLRDVMLGWTSLAPQMQLAPSGQGASTVAITLVVIGPWLVASLVPAWRAAMIDPAEVLRG
ncbi:MAG: ABC transporter permease [Deltaproteobacteria bacterium]|nr:ABC transporter permease [Deltaproteobacteria bacterium]